MDYMHDADWHICTIHNWLLMYNIYTTVEACACIHIFIIVTVHNRLALCLLGVNAFFCGRGACCGLLLGPEARVSCLCR